MTDCCKINTIRGGMIVIRIGLFVAANLAILFHLGIIMSVYGIDSRSTSGLLIFAALFGMGGSFVSLAL